MRFPLNLHRPFRSRALVVLSSPSPGIPRSAWLLCGLALALSVRPTLSAEDAESHFETRIRPVLAEACFTCHGGDNDSGQLRVDSLERLLRGGDSGPAVVPGEPERSLLLRAIRYTDEDLQMPPEDALPPEVVADFERWIRNGAVWPQAGVSANPFEAVGHWAFQPVSKPDVPEVTQQDWPQTPVDAFVLARLEQAGLSPSPPASRPTLLRRLHFDVIGLPPTRDDIERFEQDSAPDAVVRVVDALLSSPQYGERWARHWLDVARYADTKGYVFQEERRYPFSQTYRDWVIDRFNEDQPYDRFLIEQIAGDLLPESERESALAGMGFLTLGRRFLNRRHEIIDDRLDVVFRGTMALTVQCARCHDHKYDPIPTADYYSLYGVFASSRVPDELPGKMVLAETGKPVTPRIFLRGDPRNPGPEVPRQFLKVVAGPDREPFKNGSGRLELARQVASSENPLTARVIVNRLWQHHFGTALVSTPSDFGLRASPPTHPELLDYLATELVESGWSLKHLHRLILLSAVYQQSSTPNPRAAAVDAENQLLWRMNRRRLEFEPMRDALLAVSGKLNPQMGGEPVDIASEPFSNRRTIYGFVDRQNLPPVFRTFDFASPDTHAPMRYRTTVPQQTLYLRNNPFVLEQAQALAGHPDVVSASGTEERIARLFQRAYGRDPVPEELDLARTFLQNAQSAGSNDGVITRRWQYGYGEFDETGSFTKLPHWTGNAWQGGPQLPDPRLGWATIRADGGHPGDASHATILRWTAPRSGVITIGGTLEHPREEGDGVHARVRRRTGAPLAEWAAHGSQARTVLADVPVAAGEPLDFVVGSGPTQTHDSYRWSPRIAYVDEQSRQEFRHDQDFHGPTRPPLDAWTQLAQVLLLSNEFMFVD